jgi:hypothetical protein
MWWMVERTDGPNDFRVGDGCYSMVTWQRIWDDTSTTTTPYPLQHTRLDRPPLAARIPPTPSPHQLRHIRGRSDRLRKRQQPARGSVALSAQVFSLSEWGERTRVGAGGTHLLTLWMYFLDTSSLST